MFTIDIVRAYSIADTLSKVFPYSRVELMIELDPQYRALKKLYENYRELGKLVLITIANSLTSYQLSGRGEEYWTELSSYFIHEKPRDIADLEDKLASFLMSSKYNRVQLDTKIKRIRKFLRSRLARELYKTPCIYSNNQYTLLKRLSQVMNQSIYDKTIAFSVKMYYYCIRIGCREVYPDYRVPIPVDRRIALTSIISGLVRVDKETYITNLTKLVYKLLSRRYRKIVIDSWMIVSKISRIPCIFLDTIIWLIGRCLTHLKRTCYIVDCIRRYYGELFNRDELELIVSELTYYLNYRNRYR